MISEVFETVKKYDMIRPGDRVIVALSGGSDSMSLLHILYSHKDRLGITVEAAHVNHCLRGEDSENDEKFVTDYCEEKGIVLHKLRADVSGEAEKSGESLEEAGRRIRYEFFASLGDDVLIATAHNLSDRVETFLFNFTRGSGLKGLCSIPPKRENIIRPIIDCSKAEILEYCRENSVPFVTDKTNSDTAYSRNRIRHSVVPQLAAINRSFEECAGRCIESLNEDEKFLHSLTMTGVEKAEKENGFDISVLSSLPGPVRKRALSYIIEKLTGVSADSVAITAVGQAVDEYVREGRGKVIQLQNNSFLRTRAGLLEFPGENGEVPERTELEIGHNSFGNFDIELKLDDDTDCSQLFCKDFAVYRVSYDKIQGNLIARSRISGDTVKTGDKGTTKSLRKLQNERKIPPEKRDVYPVICDGDNLIAAFGCGVDAKYICRRDTSRVLTITITEKGSHTFD